MELQHHASTYSVFKHTLSPLAWDKRSKHFFLKVVMLHIKLKGMEHRAPCKRIFRPYTYFWSLGKGKMSKLIFLNVVMLHCQIKGEKYIPH